MALTLMTAACQTTGSGGTDVSCRVFAPIDWSREDTPATARQVRGHNAAWSDLCNKRKSKAR